MYALPGVPRRWPAGRAVSALVLLPMVLIGYASPLANGHVVNASKARLKPSAVPTGSDWLGEINMYRKAAGLQPVIDEAAWDAGLDAHLRYMEKTPSSYFTGQYASAHTENPASPYYSAAGAHEAGSSDLAFGDGGGTDVQTIDDWLECPFHAIGMLRPALTRVAFASVGNDAGLDVLSGLGNQSSAAPQVLFPGPGITTDLASYCGDESPSPLQTCGWPDDDEGLPLIALLTAPPSGQLAASLKGAGTEMTGQNGGLCIVDANTFKTTDAIYGPNGANILATDRAVILLPRHTFSRGTYQAQITQPGRPDILWSFTVIPPPSVVTSGLFPAVMGHNYSEHLTVAGGEAPYSWSLVSRRLPRGLTLAPNGSIEGVPSGPSSTTPLTFKVTDERGLTAVSAPIDFTVTTSAAASHIGLSVIVGTPVKQQLQASGGTGPDTWSVISGQFPRGLSINRTGLLTGTPTSLATDTVTARVTDATGQSTVQVLDISAVTVNHKPAAYAYVSAASRSCGAQNNIYGELQDDIVGPFTVDIDFTIGAGAAIIKASTSVLITKQSLYEYPFEVSGFHTATSLRAASIPRGPVVVQWTAGFDSGAFVLPELDC